MIYMFLFLKEIKKINFQKVEAYDMWSKIVPNEKIILGGKKDILEWVILVHVALAQKYILT